MRKQKEIDQGLRNPSELLSGFSHESLPKKIIHQKMISYISAFHLNVNDWFSEYENIEIFNIQLLSKLGKSSRILS